MTSRLIISEVEISEDYGLEEWMKVISDEEGLEAGSRRSEMRDIQYFGRTVLDSVE